LCNDDILMVIEPSRSIGAKESLNGARAYDVVAEFRWWNLEAWMHGEISPVAFLNAFQLNSPAPSIDGRKSRIELYGDEWPDCLPQFLEKHG